MLFERSNENPFASGPASAELSRRTVLRGFSALVPLGFLGPGLTAGRRPAVERRSDEARKIFHVDDFGAKGDCRPDTGTGTDDTAAINATIRAAQAQGGGLVVFNPDKIYLLSDPFERAPDVMGGPSIHLRPGVSLDGQGCTLYQTAKAVIIGNRPDYRAFATVMADVDAGSSTILVDFPELFAPGDPVLLRLGDNDYIPIEPNIAMIAIVRDLTGDGLVIDRPVPKWIEVGKTTLPNRRIYKMGEFLEDISIRNFHFDTAKNGAPESGIGVTVARRLTVENLWSHHDIGAGIVLAQFVEDSKFTRLVVMQNLNHLRHPAMGRALTFSNATNCHVSHIVARDLAHSFCFTESYSRGIRIDNAIVDYEENDDAQIILFTAEESEIVYKNIQIRARNRVNLHDSGGTPATYSLQNLTLKTGAYPKAMPSLNHYAGELRLRIGGAYHVYDLKNPRVFEKTIALKNGMYSDFILPAGLVLSYETWLSPQADHSDLIGIYFGSTSNNGFDIKADFKPGQWHKVSTTPGPGEDSNIYGTTQRLTESRKLLVVTTGDEAGLSGTELRFRLHIAPHRSA